MLIKHNFGISNNIWYGHLINISDYDFLSTNQVFASQKSREKKKETFIHEKK